MFPPPEGGCLLPIGLETLDFWIFFEFLEFGEFSDYVWIRRTLNPGTLTPPSLRILGFEHSTDN